jgi:hypothetical protein
MFKSLKSWLDMSIQLKVYSSRNGAGTIIYNAPVNIICYIQSEDILFINDDGAEMLSDTQIYVDGSTVVTTLDAVIFDGKTRPIRKVGIWYKNNLPSIRMIYL